MVANESPDEVTRLTTKRLPEDWTRLDERAVDTVRVLAADAVEECGSGHPGTAMSLAPVAYALFQRVLRHDPSDPEWIGRDRFVLSAGHSSLTLYIQLFLSGYGLELDDLKVLRKWGSLTPGHPEHGHTAGVEITTGPLGQGLASAVGMAMAARRERGLFDPDAEPGTSVFDHRVYVIASDGDIEEGVTSEASSLAGTQQLGNLTVIYDSNEISIEDDTRIALSEDTAKRYEAYGWHVLTVHGGEDVAGFLAAIEQARAETARPTLIVLRTVIGYPAPTKMNTGGVHGAALGPDELGAVKRALGFDPERRFQVEDEVLRHAREAAARGRADHEKWQLEFDAWARDNPERKVLLDRLGGASCRPAGPTICRCGRPTRRASPPARHRPRCSPSWARCCPSSGVARRTWRRATTPRSRARIPLARPKSPRTPGPPSPTAARCTSASASTRWARSSTVSRCTAEPVRTAAPSSSSATTCARRCAWPR